ncbi:uncharacterized protein NECHADRAFT_78914 [Fusarium vanettenii 77-13-4]|uniref:DUF6594 domain-containing protein n=1 Tax=Fusarium vanettenii (strain ATCC MYA-4622 / CBS 123669 / FGSC 9596 / NRRL 45880 / 77-13-4) TaxID=660122 RepID=C7YPY2_FUSV7|nr:uncharacterized protein NECHADRAFT_78914 [Fusarium vanettenii 77-13-4]EEU46373.1 hypothetical protein NECHADRAFT_78914 [Fusarium vanettenii 77-13-4]
MDGFPESRRQHSPASSASPQIERSKLSEAPAEGYEFNATQPPAPDVAQYATSPSPPSMIDYASTGALNTNSASTGSAVTQLTPNDDTSTGKSYTRERVPREPKHHKNKAAHRLSALSSSGSEPHSVGHDGGFVSASQELSYFKSKSRSPQAPMLEYPSPGISAPNEPYSQEQPYSQEASYPPEPPYSQPPVNPGWGPNYSGPAYPPYPYPPPPGQQPGLRPLSQQYPSGYGYLDPKATTLSTAFANRSSFHESQYPDAQDMMAGNRNGPGGNIDIPFADLTGYARIASAITGQVLPGVRPLYRRFEWLHHRLLLSYQDQLVELEDELIDLDAVSTVTRRREQGRRDLPCSEREERTEDSPYKRDKTRTMRDIGHVLDAYTQRNLIVQPETEFLRAADLVCVAREPPADAPRAADDNAEAGGDEAAPQPEVPLRALINGFSAGFACLAVSLVALPDLTSRLIVVLCFVVLAAVVMMATGNARHLRG